MAEIIVAVIIFFLIAFFLQSSKMSHFISKKQRADRFRTDKDPPPPGFDTPKLIAFEIKFNNTPPPTAVKSLTEKNTDYLVDLSAQTCTCPDFLESRSSHEVGDTRRFCKHMVWLSVEKGFAAAAHPAVVSLFDNSRDAWKGLPRDQLFLVDIEGELALVSKPETGEWANVYFRNRNRKKDGTYSYKRFGFNLAEQRWSYGYGPPGAKILRQIFKSWASEIGVK
jgi:hypothetical protein